MGTGVTFIGSLTVDIIKMIDRYPSAGMLSKIGEISSCVGGLAANTAISLKVLDPALDVRAMGMIGDDQNGEHILRTLDSYGIERSGVRAHPSLPTSFTDVMTDAASGTRTFFHQEGACAAYGYGDVAFDRVGTPHAHVGYALLLKSMDAPDPEYGAVMARALHRLQSAGITTSIDVVSESAKRYQKVVIPCLKYVDYIFLNEIEASEVTGIPLLPEAGGEPAGPAAAPAAELAAGPAAELAVGSAAGSAADSGASSPALDAAMHGMCEALLSHGVGKMAVIHSPRGGWAVSAADRARHFSPALRLPPGFIKGSVGAGDAFCAGMLQALLRGASGTEALETANLAAAANLSHSNSISGMRPLSELLRDPVLRGARERAERRD
ncbi:MAG: carbohydrate kinase family protein [Clostridiales bacterium]|nr:carbohydrate kinase family protein [Clostridiales bacterium]